MGPRSASIFTKKQDRHYSSLAGYPLTCPTAVKPETYATCKQLFNYTINTC